jgi:hypothetical protein
MKKIKSIQPSAIFQLVIIVVLFSYRGCSPANEVMEGMTVSPHTSSGQLSTAGNSSLQNYITVKPAIMQGRVNKPPVANEYILKQLVIIRPDDFQSGNIAPVMLVNAVWSK